MTRQAILAEMIAAREEARLHSDRLSLAQRGQLYDLEAELDTIEHRLLAGRESVTEALLLKAQDLARALRAVASRRAA